MRVVLVIGLINVVLFAGAQTIVPGGYVSGTWDQWGSPYIIESPIIIHEDSALYINEGVVLEFYDSAYLMAEGYIAAVGTVSDSVVFTAAQNTWMGIRIDESDTAYNDNLLFMYCSFRDAHGSSDFENGGALSVYNRDDVTIFNSSFKNNYAMNKGGAIYLENSDIQIKRTYFGFNSTSLALSSGKGGAIYMLDSEYILEDLEFSDNTSSVAGALYSDNTDLDLRNCIFSYNESHAGGGALLCHNSSLLLVDNCLFEYNLANGSGGAIALLEAVTGRFRNCTIQNNTSESLLFLADGGGVLITPHDNEVNFLNCNISHNSAGDYGGGVYATSETNFVNCLFNNNHAAVDTVDGGGGGAIFMGLSENIILNSTFSRNTGGTGTTIYCVDAGFSFINSILWDDTISSAPRIYLQYYEEPTSIYTGYSDIEGGQGVIRGDGAYEINWGSGNIDADPLFNSFGSDFSLSNESPCIDSGTLDTLQFWIPQTDLAGNPRIYRDLIDIGCYENQFPFYIAENEENNNFLIYPNPAKGHFNIRNNSENAFKGRLIMTDHIGRRIVDRNVNIGLGELISQEVFKLPAGMYYISLSSEKSTFTQKLLVQ